MPFKDYSYYKFIKLVTTDNTREYRVVITNLTDNYLGISVYENDRRIYSITSKDLNKTKLINELRRVRKNSFELIDDMVVIKPVAFNEFRYSELLKNETYTLYKSLQ